MCVVCRRGVSQEKVSIPSAAAEPDDVLAEVSDTGCGIPQEELERVFDRFSRSPRTPESSPGRAGLGLAIVRRIVELHRGRVEARSQLDVGTTLAFRLPLGEGRPAVGRDENVKVV